MNRIFCAKLFRAVNLTRRWTGSAILCPPVRRKLNPMKTKLSILLVVFCYAINASAQTPDRQFIRTDARIVALAHVRVIDGTGAAPKDDQTMVISDGKI